MDNRLLFNDYYKKLNDIIKYHTLIDPLETELDRLRIEFYEKIETKYYNDDFQKYRSVQIIEMYNSIKGTTLNPEKILQDITNFREKIIKKDSKIIYDVWYRDGNISSFDKYIHLQGEYDTDIKNPTKWTEIGCGRKIDKGENYLQNVIAKEESKYFKVIIVQVHQYMN